MPEAITTCAKCKSQFAWNTDFQEMPDCPRCGYNPNRQYQASGISGLVEKLRTGDRYESSAAAAELGKRGDREAVEPLIEALKISYAKTAAVISLGKLRDERAVEALIGVLEEGQENSSSAAKSLAQIGSERAIQAVGRHIRRVNYNDLADVFSVLKRKGKVVIPFLAPLASINCHPRSDLARLKQFAEETLRGCGWKEGDPVCCSKCGKDISIITCDECGQIFCDVCFASPGSDEGKPPGSDRPLRHCSSSCQGAARKRAEEQEQELRRREKEAEKEKRRQEQEALRLAAEERKKTIMEERKSKRQCTMCGQPLGFFTRLLGPHHVNCTKFKE